MRLTRLEWRLPAAIAVLLLLVSGTLAALTYTESRRAAVVSARLRLQHLVSLLGGSLETNAENVRQSAAQLGRDADVVAVLGGDPVETLRARFAANLKSNTTSYGFEVWRATGEAALVTAADGAPEVDPEWSGFPGWAAQEGVTISRKKYAVTATER